MKKLFFNLAVVAVSMFVVSSCSNGKTTEPNAEGEAAEVEAVEVTELDYQGVTDLMNSGKETLTEDDVDFLLDQMEVIIKKTEGMTKEEYNAYLSALTGEEQEVVMMIAFGLAGAEQQNILTEDQKTRFEDLNARTPNK